MRKFFAAMVAATLVAGGLFADEIKGVIFKKYADGKVTVEIDGKEKTLPVDPKATVKKKDKKSGEMTETPLTTVFEKVKADSKWTVTVEDGKVTKVVSEDKGKGKKGAPTEEKKTEEKKDK